MNRLTESIDGIAVSKERYDKHSPCHYCEYQSTDNCLQEECTYANALQKLSAYEETGLEPQEVEQVKAGVKEILEAVRERGY